MVVRISEMQCFYSYSAVSSGCLLLLPEKNGLFHLITDLSESVVFDSGCHYYSRVIALRVMKIIPEQKTFSHLLAMRTGYFFR